MIRQLNNRLSFLFLSTILFLILNLLLINSIILSIFLTILITILIIGEDKVAIILCIVAFMIPVESYNNTARVISIILFLGILIYFFIKRYNLFWDEYPIIPANLVKYIILILVSMAFSALMSPTPVVGIIEVGKIVLFFVIVYGLYSIILYSKEFTLFFYSFIFVGFILAVSILIQFYNTGFNIVLNLGFNRFGGLIQNVNAAGAIFIIAIPILVTIKYWNNYKLNKIIYLPAIILFCISLLLTNSRASILSVIIALLFIFYFIKRKIFSRLIIALCFIFLIIFFIPQVNEVVNLLARVENLGANREFFWESTWSIINNNLIFGTGPGQLENNIYKSMPFILGSRAEQQILGLIEEGAGTGFPHNFYLYRFAETGVLGFIASLLLPFIFFNYFIKAKKNISPENFQHYVILVICGGIGLSLFFRGFLESTNLITNGWISRDISFWLIFAIIIAFNNLSSDENFNTFRS